MTGNEQATQRLRDIIDIAEELAEIVRDRTFEDFEQDNLLRRGVERLVEIVGEATTQAIRNDSSLQSQIPDSRSIIGMRNRLAHGYDDLHESIIWDTAVFDIPMLADKVRELLGEEENK